jgi:hypothetical protein
VKLFFGTKRWAHEGREFLHMGKHLQQAFEVRNNYFVLEIHKACCCENQNLETYLIRRVASFAWPQVYQETLGDDHISTIRAHEAALALERLRRE